MMMYTARTIFVLLFMLAVCPLAAQAHDIIPRSVYDYIVEHPNATSSEVQAFIAANEADLADKYATTAAVDRLIDRQDAGWLVTLKDFFQFGIEHILLGFDHVLFVLSLLLVFISLRHVLHLTLSFTLAHSITLILAGTGIVVLSPRIVEPLIALSIAVMALGSAYMLRQPGRAGNTRLKIALVFFFGLFHGLGFAGLLQDIHIPQGQFVPALISFNLGIELGQICIVLVVLPFILQFFQRRWYPHVIQAVAFIIAIIALFWLIQRVFLT